MLDFIVNIFQTPPIVLGLVAMVGLLLQRKRAGEVFAGTVKTAIGMLIVGAGASLIVTEILPFVGIFSSVFNLSGFATSSEAVSGAIQSALPVVARTSSLILAIGFLVNIIVARVSPLKFIFLTGHMMWILAVSVAYVLYLGGFSETMIIVVGSIIDGLVMVILPAIAQPLVIKTTKSNGFGYAHLTTLGVVPAAYIGGLVGDVSKDAEDINMPESLDFFKDTSMSVAIIMGVFYLLLTIIAGPSVVSEYAGGSNYIIFGLLKALGFTAGILVLLQGVRMFLGEIVPAFKGVADKLVPGAIPALDVPALFGFAPNSLMIGFVTSVVGMIVAMFVSSLVLGAVPLVSIIGGFFTGGVAGIFGNAVGGRRGAAVSGFVYGFLLIFGSALLFKFFDFATGGVVGVGHDCVDIMVLSLLMKNPYIGIGALLVVFFVLSAVYHRKNKKES